LSALFVVRLELGRPLPSSRAHTDGVHDERYTLSCRRDHLVATILGSDQLLPSWTEVNPRTIRGHLLEHGATTSGKPSGPAFALRRHLHTAMRPDDGGEPRARTAGSTADEISDGARIYGAARSKSPWNEGSSPGRSRTDKSVKTRDFKSPAFTVSPRGQNTRWFSIAADRTALPHPPATALAAGVGPALHCDTPKWIPPGEALTNTWRGSVPSSSIG
jgi:hypothetical protein